MFWNKKKAKAFRPEDYPDLMVEPLKTEEKEHHVKYNSYNIEITLENGTKYNALLEDMSKDYLNVRCHPYSSSYEELNSYQDAKDNDHVVQFWSFYEKKFLKKHDFYYANSLKYDIEDHLGNSFIEKLANFVKTRKYLKINENEIITTDTIINIKFNGIEEKTFSYKVLDIKK